MGSKTNSNDTQKYLPFPKERTFMTIRNQPTTDFISRFRCLTYALLPVRSLLLRSISVWLIRVWTASLFAFDTNFCNDPLDYIIYSQFRAVPIWTNLLICSRHLHTLVFFFYSFHVDSEQKLVNSMSEGKCDGKTHFHKGKEELLRARWHYPDEYCVRSRTHKHWFLSRLLRAELWLTLLALLLHYY